MKKVESFVCWPRNGPVKVVVSVRVRFYRRNGRRMILAECPSSSICTASDLKSSVNVRREPRFVACPFLFAILALLGRHFQALNYKCCRVREIWATSLHVAKRQTRLRRGFCTARVWAVLGLRWFGSRNQCHVKAKADFQMCPIFRTLPVQVECKTSSIDNVPGFLVRAGIDRDILDRAIFGDEFCEAM